MGENARSFLFLQGPHGPFFRKLAGALSERGASVSRVAFNAADVAEWRDSGPVHSFTAPAEHFEEWFDRLLMRERITDIVLYGDSRPVHEQATGVARTRGLGTHFFEEGYLRPSWITYERQGTNGLSPLASIPMERIAAAIGGADAGIAKAPAHWGDSRQHLWFSACYHGRLLIPSWRFRNYRGHRELPLWREALFYVRRTAGAPWQRIGRAVGRRRLFRAGAPYHLALLQLSFDCSMRAHSRFQTNADFADELIDGFVRGAPEGEHLVFKAHPFEDGRERIGERIRALAEAHGIADRVHFIDGGQALAGLVDRAQTVATVNSTAAHQALQRGLPVLALGRSVYARPELVTMDDPAAFFAQPRAADPRIYRIYRSFLLRTAALPGSFYSANGIARALRRLPDAMLDPVDRYQRLLEPAGPVPANPCRAKLGQHIVA